MTRADDELVGRLVAARSLALGRLAPGGYRVAAAGGAAFAAAVRVVDRVHGHAAVDGLAAQPAAATGLADRGIGVILVRDRADGREAGAVHAALLARVEAQDRPALVAAHILGIGTGRARDLTALAGLHLDVVDDGADRHALERHRVARLHVDTGERRHHLVAGRETLRGEDIGEFAVIVLHERDERGPVRIVFQPLDSADRIELGAAEIDHAVGALVSAATVKGGDPAVIVAAALAG